MDDVTVLVPPEPLALVDVAARWTGKSWVLRCSEYPGLLCETLSLENVCQLVAETIDYVSGRHGTEIAVSVIPECSFSVTLARSDAQWTLWIPGIGAQASLRRQEDAEKVSRRIIAEHLNTRASLIQIELHRATSAGRVCPTPRKSGYRSKLEAKVALASTQRSKSSRREEIRAYRCVCGGWHLTSRP